MQEFYEVSPSRTQLILLLVAYLPGAVTFYFYLDPAFLKCAALAALTVAAWLESRRLIQQDIILLRINLARSSIELQQCGQPYFYCKYKVYQTRWFAILKLVNEHKSRTLILNPDRFKSTQSYRQMRYLLRKMEQRNVA